MLRINLINRILSCFLLKINNFSDNIIAFEIHKDHVTGGISFSFHNNRQKTAQGTSQGIKVE